MEDIWPRLRARTVLAEHRVVIVVQVHDDALAESREVVLILGRTGAFHRAGEDREGEPGEDRDDRNDDEQFDEGEGVGFFHRFHGVPEITGGVQKSTR